MGLGVNLAIGPITQVFSGSTSDTLSLVFSMVSIVIGGVGFVVGIIWIVTTAEMIGGISPVQKALRPLKTDSDPSQLTGLFIRFLTFYRSKRTTVRRMVLFGRLGGFLMVVGGVAQLVSVGLRQGLPVEYAGCLVMIGVGVGYLWITNLFRNYSSGWEKRLEESTRVEHSLEQTLADSS
jgi:hypothetical protein